MLFQRRGRRTLCRTQLRRHHGGHLVERHLHYTNSARARAVLADWKNMVTKFVKVMPVDYRRALTEMQAQEAPRPAKDKIKNGKPANG